MHENDNLKYNGKFLARVYHYYYHFVFITIFIICSSSCLYIRKGAEQINNLNLIWSTSATSATTGMVFIGFLSRIALPSRPSTNRNGAIQSVMNKTIACLFYEMPAKATIIMPCISCARSQLNTIYIPLIYCCQSTSNIKEYS